MDIFDVGVRVKTLRKNHHLTQEQFAEKIDVSQHYVYEIERGLKTMSIYTLANVADALDAPIDYIVNGKIYENEDGEDFYPKDSLTMLIETIPLTKRDNVYKVLKNILPYIK